MTVTYTAKIATVKFKTLWRLLRRWRGSVYKNVWKDWLVFASLYFSLSFLYRVILTEDQRRVFEKIVLFCNKERTGIPVAFVLGFYVTIVLNRWWSQVNDVIPWPDNFCLNVTALVHGNDDRGRLMRRTLVRYLNLSWILALCSISTVAKKRFPTLEHLVEIGMMTKNEQEIFENIRTQSNKYYIPIVWATTLLSRARKEERITSDYALKHLLEILSRFRGSLGELFNYDWLSVPLVYTQVVTIATQAYFLSSVLGKQFLDPSQNYPGHEVDIYIPIFTFLEFLFYMGWLKVAESLINPFGEDDDDFDTNWVIDRNIQVSYLIVDDMHSEHPELIKDAYWDTVEFSLPYTAAAEQYKVEPYLGSTVEIELKQEEAMFMPLPMVQEDELYEPEINGIGSRSHVSHSNAGVIKSSLQRLFQGGRRITQAKGNNKWEKPMEDIAYVETPPLSYAIIPAPDQRPAMEEESEVGYSRDFQAIYLPSTLPDDQQSPGPSKRGKYEPTDSRPGQEWMIEESSKHNVNAVEGNNKTYSSMNRNLAKNKNANASSETFFSSPLGHWQDQSHVIMDSQRGVSDNTHREILGCTTYHEHRSGEHRSSEHRSGEHRSEDNTTFDTDLPPQSVPTSTTKPSRRLKLAESRSIALKGHQFYWNGELCLQNGEFGAAAIMSNLPSRRSQIAEPITNNDGWITSLKSRLWSYIHGIRISQGHYSSVRTDRELCSNSHLSGDTQPSITMPELGIPNSTDVLHSCDKQPREVATDQKINHEGSCAQRITVRKVKCD